MKKFFLALLLIISIDSKVAFAGAPACLNFISSIDWRFFVDEIEFKFDGCRCEIGDSGVVKAGWYMGISEPIAVLDSTNDPWAFPCLDLKLDTRVDRAQGTSQDGGDNTGGQKQYHFMIFPVFGILNFLQEYFCFERVTSINIAMMSEVLPQSKNDILANIIDGGINLLTANPIAQAACVVDCMTSIFGEPANSMFWCTGCQVPVKTHSSFIPAKDAIAEAAAAVQKVLKAMHQGAMLTKTSNASFMFTTTEAGSVMNSMCEERLFFERIKSQYSYNINTPTVGEAFPTGDYPLTIGAFKNTITSADNISFWLWRKREYCVGAYKCRSTFANFQN